MGTPAYIKINGKTVEGEWISPEEVPFIANPRVANTAMFLAGAGLAALKAVRNIANASLNPPLKSKVVRALPWAFAAGLTAAIAPALGKAKNPVRIGAALLGLKAVNEIVRKPEEERA